MIHENKNNMSELVRDTDAARLLGVAVQTVRNWRCKGRGPAYVVVGDRGIRYSLDDIVKYRDQKRVELQV